MFAGNKCDIPRERRTVLKEVVSNYVHYELPRLRAKVSGFGRLRAAARGPSWRALAAAASRWLMIWRRASLTNSGRSSAQSQINV